jgi:hypothetical protein
VGGRSYPCIITSPIEIDICGDPMYLLGRHAFSTSSIRSKRVSRKDL